MGEGAPKRLGANRSEAKQPDECLPHGKMAMATKFELQYMAQFLSLNKRVLTLVMSPCICITPGRGAMACKSTATILTLSLSSGRSWINFLLST